MILKDWKPSFTSLPDIKELRPKRKAMKEAKAVIEEKYGVKLEGSWKMK